MEKCKEDSVFRRVHLERQTVTAVVVCWSVFHTFVPADMLVFDEMSPRMLLYMLAEYQELMFLSILN